MANLKDDSTFQLLDASIEDGLNNMKILSSRFDKILSLKREVELKEKAAKEAKEETETSCLDIIAEVEALKQANQRLKEANHTRGRKVHEHRAVLAKDFEELQLRVSHVLNKGHEYLDVSEEILNKRLAEAVREKEFAEKDKLEKEMLTWIDLSLEERQMLKLIKEAEELKEEEVKNSKLQASFKERESAVDILLGDVYAKCQDI